MKDIKKFGLLLLFGIGFIACDEIDDPFPEGAGNSISLDGNTEYIVDPELNINTAEALLDLITNNNWDSVIAADNSTARFTVIEEFTGHTCINCSIGTKEVVRLKGLLGDTLVPVAIHAGQFAAPRTNDTMYTTDHRVDGGHGELYQQTFNPGDEYPRGIVNRFGGLVSGVFEWEGQINSVKNDVPNVKIDLVNYYDSTINVLRIDIYLEWFATLSESYNLQVMVTEDNIIDWQYDLGVNKPNYNHRFVLRKVVNGTWGKDLNPPVDGESQRIQYIIPLDTAWKSNDLSTAVYIYNNSTNSYEVIQANSAAIK